MTIIFIFIVWLIVLPWILVTLCVFSFLYLLRYIMVLTFLNFVCPFVRIVFSNFLFKSSSAKLRMASPWSHLVLRPCATRAALRKPVFDIVIRHHVQSPWNKVPATNRNRVNIFSPNGTRKVHQNSRASTFKHEVVVSNTNIINAIRVVGDVVGPPLNCSALINSILRSNKIFR